MLNQIPHDERIDSISGDCAYDAKDVYSATGQHKQENCVINFMDKDSQQETLQHEIALLKLQIESREKELVARDMEIASLKKIISLLEAS